MCEVVQKASQFRLNLDKKARTNDRFIRAPTMEFPINGFGEHQAGEILGTNYSKQQLSVAVNDSISRRYNYISLLKVPTLSGPFSENLIIGPEIKELLSRNVNFKYILFNILKILNNIFDKYERQGRVEVTLETDEDNPRWKHADITVKLNDDSLDSEIWRKVSKDSKDFYKALEVSKVIPCKTIKLIHKFIYIIVDSE